MTQSWRTKKTKAHAREKRKNEKIKKFAHNECQYFVKNLEILV